MIKWINKEFNLSPATLIINEITQNINYNNNNNNNNNNTNNSTNNSNSNNNTTTATTTNKNNNSTYFQLKGESKSPAGAFLILASDNEYKENMKYMYKKYLKLPSLLSWISLLYIKEQMNTIKHR